ncbi:hypothetical protein GCM10010530_69920 [Kribbella aluminosa]
MYRLVLRHLLRTGQLMSVLGALPLVALGLGAGPVWVLIAAFVAGIGFSISGISWDTSLQEHVDRGVLSRLASIDDLLSFIAIPAGTLAAGPLADRFGPRHVTLAAAIVYGAAAWSSLLFKDVRDLPHGPEQPPVPPQGPKEQAQAATGSRSSSLSRRGIGRRTGMR